MEYLIAPESNSLTRAHGSDLIPQGQLRDLRGTVCRLVHVKETLSISDMFFKKIQSYQLHR
jgi:hypothetical protein